MGFLNKKSIKIIFGFLIILAVSIAVLFIASNSQKNDDYDRQLQLAKEMEEKYKNDTYGGDTPEETLQLFIDALKAGDIELASKYFVVDKQGEWKEKLGKINENQKINLLIEDLNKLEKTIKSNDATAFFVLTNQEEVVIVQLVIVKNPVSNKWKIEEL